METENIFNQSEEENIEPEIEQLSFSDKLIGVITSPSETFSSIAKFPLKVADWIIPVIFIISIASLSIILLNSNPEIKNDMLEKQLAALEESFAKAIEDGDMTQETANQQYDRFAERMESSGGLGYIYQIIGVVFFTFLIFIIVSGIFYLISKFALKGDGNYMASLVAYGLPQYIIVLQIIVIMIASLYSNKLITATSLATVLNMEPTDLTGFIVSKIDPFRIWFYAVISIGYAKMFKSENTTKYFIAVFGLWLGFSLAVFIASQYIPVLKWLAVY